MIYATIISGALLRLQRAAKSRIFSLQAATTKQNVLQMSSPVTITYSAKSPVPDSSIWVKGCGICWPR